MSETENLATQEPGADSETANLNPQEPGAPPSPQLLKLTDLLAKGAKAITAQLPALDDEELSLLRTIEAASPKPRPLVLKAIDVELDHRAADAGLPSAAAEPEADTLRPYAHLPASAVDQSQLRHPVQTRDGWLMPLPMAQG